eukprot:GHRQ01003201.1.p2 GENE.GHRQ01003201.1~~GHRQ01003201.1.p2  ORF type:complete len:209 (+),score=101.09 GHRQ01003201.1:336-962(+)
MTRPAPHFHALSGLLPIHVLGVSPEGHAVIVVKTSGAKAMVDAVFKGKDSTLTPAQLEDHLALVNEFLVKAAAPDPLPAGSQVQIYDLAGFKLSYAMGGDIMSLFQLLMEFGTYYPERLHQAIILNAPSWFNVPWKMITSFLDANTRAKIVVVRSPGAALQQLSHHLHGEANVPVAWGGKCALPFEQYPGHRQLLQLVEKLNAGSGGP